MNNAANVYTPSGKLGNGLILMPLAGLASVLVLGYIYGYLCVYIPLKGYVSFLIPLGYGIAVGWVLYQAGFWAKCRSNGFVLAASVVFALLAIYTSWVSFFCALLGYSAPTGTAMPGFINLFFAPGVVWDVACEVAETGWYSVRRLTPSGFVLWTFWLIEAGIIGGLVALVPFTRLQERVFCEHCGCWCKDSKELARFLPSADNSLLERIKAGDLLALADLEPGAKPLEPHLRLHSQRCEGCDETATFQVSSVKPTRNGNGDIEEKTEDLTGHVFLRADALRAFQEALAAKATARLAKSPPAA